MGQKAIRNLPETLDRDKVSHRLEYSKGHLVNPEFFFQCSDGTPITVLTPRGEEVLGGINPQA